MKRIQIERKSKVLPEDIAREHLWGVGKPVIITDGTENWPARSKWTFKFLKTVYGSDLATAWFGIGAGPAKVTTLSAYINYLDTPSAELPGMWAGKDGRPPEVVSGQADSPLYLYGWNAFGQHPELYNDIAPAPYFVLDLVWTLSPALRNALELASKKQYTAVYIGPKGSLSSLHRDYWNTHAYLAQIQGRKRAILFSPKDWDFLYGGQIDPEQPDFERFPLFDSATAYECIIEPGETLLIPANWLHHVRGLEKSITVSHNFFNDSNFKQYMIQLLRHLPVLAKAIDKSPNSRAELRVKWCLSDFLAGDMKNCPPILPQR